MRKASIAFFMGLLLGWLSLGAAFALSRFLVFSTPKDDEKWRRDVIERQKAIKKELDDAAKFLKQSREKRKEVIEGLKRLNQPPE